MPSIIDVIGSYRGSFSTGSLSGVGAGTSALGHVFVMRWATTGKAARIRSIELDFLVTTAFTAAQEMGFDVYLTRAYTAAHTGGTAIAPGANDHKKRTGYPQSAMTARIATTAALTNGTHTIDGNGIGRCGMWCGAIGAHLEPVRWDFSSGAEPGGLIIGNEEGLIIRNTIAMGALGAGKLHVTVDWDEVLLAA